MTEGAIDSAPAPGAKPLGRLTPMENAMAEGRARALQKRMQEAIGAGLSPAEQNLLFAALDRGQSGTAKIAAVERALGAWKAAAGPPASIEIPDLGALADTPAGVACAVAVEAMGPAIAALNEGQLPASHPLEVAIEALGPEGERAAFRGQVDRCRGTIAEAVNAVAQRDPVKARKLLEQARGLLIAAPQRRVSYGIADILAPLPPTPWVVKGLQWCPGRPPMIIGYPGSGKTLAAQAAALALITQRSIWGCPDFRPARPMRVMHIDFDQGRAATFKRYQRLMAGMGITSEEIATACSDLAALLDCTPESIGDMLRVEDSPPDLRLMSLDEIPAFEAAWARKVRGFDVVIVDSLRKLAPTLDENDSRFGEIPEVLRRVSEAMGCTILLLHHTARAKPNEKRPAMQAGRGSGAVDGAAGAQLVIEVENPDDPGPLQRRRVVHARASVDAEGGTIEAFYVAFTDGEPMESGRPVQVLYRTVEQVHGPGQGSDKLAPVKSAVLAYVRQETIAERPVAGKAVIAAKLGISASIARLAVDQLEADGLLIDRPEKAGKGPAKPRLWANLGGDGDVDLAAEPCPRCGGKGIREEYAHRDGGKCFACNGSGRKSGSGPPRRRDPLQPRPAPLEVPVEHEREPIEAPPVAPARATPAPAPSSPDDGDPLAGAKEAILALLRDARGVPGRDWVREQLRPHGYRESAVKAAWGELLLRGLIENRGKATRPAWHGTQPDGDAT